MSGEPTFKITTEVTIPPHLLGVAFAEWSSDQQADFIVHAATSLHALRGDGTMQLHYTAEALKGNEAALPSVVWFLQNILDRIDP